MTFLQQFEHRFSTITNKNRKSKITGHIERLSERLKTAHRIRTQLKAQFNLGRSLRRAALWIAVERCVSLFSLPVSHIANLATGTFLQHLRSRHSVYDW